MSIEKHAIQLTAQDQVSPAFKKVGQAATEAGRSAEQASTRATKSAKDWSTATIKLGSALGAIGGIAMKMGADAEVSQTRLEQSIENTGVAYEELADQINKATDAALDFGFDDEDAADAISAITNATGDATKAIEDLSLAEDIARGRGISLAQATNIVIAAEQGRISSLKRMGIALDENATSEEALAALQSKYAGQAEAYASTSAASYDRLANAAENYMEAVGQFLNDNAQLVFAIGGIATAAGPAIDGIKGIGAAIKDSAAASKAATVLASPWTALAAAAVVTGLAIYDLARDHDNLEHAAERAAMRESQLTGTISDLADQLERVGLLQQAINAGEFLTNISEGAEQREADLAALTDEIANFSAMAGAAGESLVTVVDGVVVLTNALGEQGMAFSQRTSDVLSDIGALDDGVVTTQELAAAQAFMAGNFEASADTLDQYNTAFQDAIKLAADYRYDGQAIIDNINAINTAVQNGTITEEQGIALLKAINDERAFYNKTIQESTNATNDATLAQYALNEAMADQAKRGAEQDAYWEKHTANVVKGFENVAHASDTGGKALSNFSEELSTLAASLQDVGSAGLDRYMQMIVGFTDGIVDSVGAAKDWADALIAPVGTYSELDNLLANNLISMDQYKEAQQAQIDITEDYNRAATARNQIQAMQAPLIAEQADASADYLETLAGMNEQEQLLALAWADQDTAKRANDIAEMAAQYDDMGQAGKDAFAEMVTSAAATDPALAAVLENLGLIKKSTTDPTGWEVNMDTMGAETDMDRLIDTLNDLITTLSEVYNLNVTSTFDTTSFWQAYNALPGSKAINVYTVSGDYGFTPGLALGGTAKDTLDYAAAGRVGRGHTLVGENGPELVTLPYGSLVTPNHATRYRDTGSSGGVTINGPITVVANNPESFMRQMRSYETGMNRR